jgi:hypothetical protein
MSIFIISLLAGLALHQLVSIIQPTDNESEYQFGRRIVLTFSDGIFVRLKAIAVAVAGLLFVMLVVILNAQFAHPVEGYPYRFAEVLTSPRAAAAVFGGLVGLLIGNLINRVLQSEEDYQFTSSDRLEMIVIFVLLILGIGGEELLRSAAQRINKVSVGTTTEISFADAAPKSSRVSAEQPTGAFRNTQGKSGGTFGLQKLYDIGSVDDYPNIERDDQFIEVLARYENAARPNEVDTGRLPFDLLSPMASCLSDISRLFGDDAFIDEQLLLMADALRELAEADDPHYPDIQSPLGRSLKAVVKFRKDRQSEFARSPRPDGKQTRAMRLPQEERSSCDRLLANADNGKAAAALTDVSINTFRASREALPYVAISYASVMAALHYYESAVLTMDNWSQRHFPTDVAAGWYLLRAKMTQSLFTEEWIRDRGAAVSSSLRKYHIDNLKSIVLGMRSLSGISELSRKNDSYKISVGLLGASHAGDDGICDIPTLPKLVPRDPSNPEDDKLKASDAQERLRVLYDTYLSAQKDYIDHSLKHPIEKLSTASLIQSEAEGLMRLSLKCGPLRKDNGARKLRTRAEHIERYVRNELNLLESTSSLKSDSQIRSKIRDSRQMLALAFQLIEPQVTAAKEQSRTGRIQDRITTLEVLEIYETLLATQAQLQSISEREIAN